MMGFRLDLHIDISPDIKNLVITDFTSLMERNVENRGFCHQSWDPENGQIAILGTEKVREYVCGRVMW